MAKPSPKPAPDDHTRSSPDDPFEIKLLEDLMTFCSVKTKYGGPMGRRIGAKVTTWIKLRKTHLLKKRGTAAPRKGGHRG